MPLHNPTGSDDLTTITAAATDAPGREAVQGEAEGEAWLDRMESMIERYPWPTLILALGIGYALARKLR